MLSISTKSGRWDYSTNNSSDFKVKVLVSYFGCQQVFLLLQFSLLVLSYRTQAVQLLGLRPFSGVITARKRSLGQGNICSSVCQEFCSRGGGCVVSQHALRQTPPTRHPLTRHPSLPTRYPPQTRCSPQTRHPPVQCMLGDTVNKWAVCMQLECNLVKIDKILFIAFKFVRAFALTIKCYKVSRLASHQSIFGLKSNKN